MTAPTRILLSCVGFFSVPVEAQSVGVGAPAVLDDGRLDEAVYAQISAITAFVRQEPHDGAAVSAVALADLDRRKRVRDSGTGIAPQLLPRIFKPADFDKLQDISTISEKAT